MFDGLDEDDQREGLEECAEYEEDRQRYTCTVIGPNGYDNVHSGHGYGSRNTERERILEFVTAQDMVVVNSFFKKPEQHLITHQSGGHCSQIDYVLLRKKDLKVSKNIKV